MQTKQWGNEYRTTSVCIDSYENQVMVGRFYNPCYPEEVRFHGVMDFLKKIDNMLDQMNFPQAFTSVRTFAKMPMQISKEVPEEKTQKGNIATFSMRVLFRQNTSWQGSLTWLEGEREESFRSVLELLLLLDSAVAGGGVA